MMNDEKYCYEKITDTCFNIYERGVGKIGVMYDMYLAENIVNTLNREKKDSDKTKID